EPDRAVARDDDVVRGVEVVLDDCFRDAGDAVDSADPGGGAVLSLLAHEQAPVRRERHPVRHVRVRSHGRYRPGREVEPLDVDDEVPREGRVVERVLFGDVHRALVGRGVGDLRRLDRHARTTSRSGWAGSPTTTQSAGTSCATMLPAPISARAPIVTPE